MDTWGWAAVHHLFLGGSQTQIERKPEEKPNPTKMQQQQPQIMKSPVNPTFYRTPFHAPADGSKKPSVTLQEWWLVKAEGHERKISVAGLYLRKQQVREFVAGLIVKRHAPCKLETEDGIIVFTYGPFNRERTLGNGFTTEAYDKFFFGFPHWWKDWNLYYPDIMESQTVSQPRSSRTSSSCEDSNVSSASMVESTDAKGIDNYSHVNKGCQKTTMTSMRWQSLHGKIIPDEATHVTCSEKMQLPPVKSKPIQ